MNWGALSGVFFLATIKFMFAPFTGAGLGLSFFETVIISFSGSIISAFICYSLSEALIKRNQEKNKKKRLEAAHKGIILNDPSTDTNWGKKKRVLSRAFNRLIVNIKRRFGIYGLCFFAPLLLSVPIGSIVCAKFYGTQKNTFIYIAIGLGANSVLLSLLAFLVF
ncbi:MAG: hypothetical protein ACI9XP_000341 [Lentimonas sp.]|jgi:hypothetical protein